MVFTPSIVEPATPTRWVAALVLSFVSMVTSPSSASISVSFTVIPDVPVKLTLLITTFVATEISVVGETATEAARVTLSMPAYSSVLLRGLLSRNVPTLTSLPFRVDLSRVISVACARSRNELSTPIAALPILNVPASAVISTRFFSSAFTEVTPESWASAVEFLILTWTPVASVFFSLFRLWFFSFAAVFCSSVNVSPVARSLPNVSMSLS